MSALKTRSWLIFMLAGVVACGDDSGDGDAMGAAGTTNDSGSGGSAEAGSGGSAEAGSGGSAEAGSGGSAEAGSGGSAAGSGGSAEAGSGGSAEAGSGGGAGNGAEPTAEEVADWIDDYMAAHPGMDGDINNKTPEQLAADPDAQRLVDLCGEDQRPVIPQLVWEYGGSSHAWEMPEAAALVYCVYIPVSPSTDNWQYDEVEDHVIADVYVLFLEQNPCADETGADQIAQCIGAMGNYEILVDTASLNDGADAGLSLSEASTELRLVLPDGNKVHLWDDI